MLVEVTLRRRGSASPVALVHPSNSFQPRIPSNLANMAIDESSKINDPQVVHMTRVAVARNSKLLPKVAQKFLREMSPIDLDLHQFVKFWSFPTNIECIQSTGLARTVRNASLSLALNYLYLGEIRYARALMLNGTFMLECMDYGIESIAEWCRNNVNIPCRPQFKHFCHAFHSVKTRKTMEELIKRLMCEFHRISPREVMKNCGFVSKNQQKISSEMSPASKHIQLIIEDSMSAEERQTITIGSSTTLRTLFNEYAERRGVSLRSLRFSYNGKTLFLSSAGKRTPDELIMKDQDVITVRCTNNLVEETSSSSITTKEKKAVSKLHTKKHNDPGKGKNGKGKKKQVERKDALELEDHMAHHSTKLSKLHEEVQPRLKEIRTRLNALDLKRQSPKKKSKHKVRKECKGNSASQISVPDSGLGGKAGKPQFILQVGEVGNLYKTTKLQRSDLHNASTLDLHGCTRDEALGKLDESLGTWVDAAMRGPYPFVIPARIVCGCGNQILSETVEGWIRDRDQVAKCPKGFYR